MKTRDNYNNNNSESVRIKPEFNNNSCETKTFVNPFRYNFEITNSSSKRIADQNLNNNYCDNNQLLKKIKTEKSYEPNAEKSCINQETDGKLNDKSFINQSLIKGISQLSLSKTSNQTSMPSTSFQSYETISQTQPITQLFNNLNINFEEQNSLDLLSFQSSEDNCFDNHKRIKNKSSKKKKKKNKSKTNCFKKKYMNKKKKKKIKSVKESNAVKKTKIQSNILRDLKVSYYESQGEEEIQRLIALKNEGIVLKHRKRGDFFKCLVCNKSVGSFSSAENHSHSSDHLSTKAGHKLSGIDFNFAVDIESYSDIEVIISRLRELKKINRKVKSDYYKHGIRLKNGFGEKAYVCSKCDLWFESLTEVKKHFEMFDKSRDQLNQYS
jgi:hypothetical protein